MAGAPRHSAEDPAVVVRGRHAAAVAPDSPRDVAPGRRAAVGSAAPAVPPARTAASPAVTPVPVRVADLRPVAAETRLRRSADLPSTTSIRTQGGAGGSVLPTARLASATLTTTGPVRTVRQSAPGSAFRADRRAAAAPARHSIPLAACAVAVLGAVSTGAILLPGRSSAASAEVHDAAVVSPTPRPTPAATITPAAAARAAQPIAAPARSRAAHARAASAAAPLDAPVIRATPGPVPIASTAPVAPVKPTPPTIRTPVIGPPEPALTPTPTPTPTATATPTPTRTPSPTPTPIRPFPISTPPTTRALRNAVEQAPAHQLLGLLGGTYQFSNFAHDLLGVDLPANLPGIIGAGRTKTVIEMAPHTSSKKHDVPHAAGTTNQLSLMRVSGSPELSDFTLLGTGQGHLYNGLRLNHTHSARLTDVTVRAIPGDSHVNPGETFGINDFRTHGSVYNHVEVDGAGVGASGLGFNNSTDVTVENSYFHGNPYSAGVTFWQTEGIHLKNVTSTHNKTGLNFERTSGHVTIDRPTFHSDGVDIHIGSDRHSSVYTITDPVFSGSKLTIMIQPHYMGHTNKQKKSDIHVIIDGVDRTSEVVRFIG